MSRSYRKVAVCKDWNCHNTGKKRANRKVRRAAGCFNRGLYKHLFCQYDIHDCIFYETEEDFKKYWEDEVAECQLVFHRGYYSDVWDYGNHARFKRLNTDGTVDEEASYQAYISHYRKMYIRK